MTPKLNPSLALVALSLSLASAASAALTSIALPGTTQTDVWARDTASTDGPLTIAGSPGRGGFPGSAPWGSPILSPSGGDANLLKTANGAAGGPYPAGSGLYFGSFGSVPNTNGGQLTVTEPTAIAGLSTVVFQVEIGEAWTYDLYNDVLPTLSYNGGSQNLAATYSSLFDKVYNGTIAMPSGEETLYINTYALQWDLASLGPITSFSISFNGVEHATLSALQLDQGSAQAPASLLPAAVPEPTALAFLAASLALTGRRRRA